MPKGNRHKGNLNYNRKGNEIMYLCIVYVMGDPREDEGNYVSCVSRFNTIEEARCFQREISDYDVYVDIFKGEYVG